MNQHAARAALVSVANGVPAAAPYPAAFLASARALTGRTFQLGETLYTVTNVRTADRAAVGGRVLIESRDMWGRVQTWTESGFLAAFPSSF